MDSQGFLSDPIDTVSSGGDLPAYTAALSNGRVGVMNYGSGTGRILKTTSAGSKFDDTAPVINFLRSGNVSHPHQIVEYNNELFVPDLGQDTIWRLSTKDGNSYSVAGSIAQPNGSGPRHIAFASAYIFLSPHVYGP